ncbi:MAG: NADH-quinone oxidoreductase subunit NuoE [Deltaproteobacteria bacterium]|nr:NADH-quinone oxidoreductase subunit NuoE [Deltaproteobacteria bacterium]MCB9785913.1 NADH-quinone oxidoreductase subunit NuoE [Deltaproteobacteria bacterium]
MALAFSPEADREITDIIGRYPERAAALIPVLFVAQDEFTYLSEEVLELVAERLDLPAAKVLNTATFYTMLRKAPVGKHHVQVCRTLSCYLRGADQLMATAQRKLGIAPGETTGDGRFTLEGVECLAACGTAPIVRINDVYHENVTPASLERLLDALASGKGEPVGGGGGD